jgi:glycosyltransferase involved in cell wall biosynthesis
VIPTLNSSRTVEKCLASIRKQNYPYIEIILIDGFSTDGTTELAKRYVDHLYHYSGSLSESRQIGVEKSKGEIIGIFDSDVILPHTFWLLRAIEQFLLDDKIATVWPLQIPPKNAPAISWCYLAHQWSLIRYRIKKRRGVLGGGNALFRREYIQEVGGYDPNLDYFEDFNLGKKLMEKGYKVVLHEDPIYHDTHRSLSEFIRKSFRKAKTLKDKNLERLMELPKNELFYEYCILPVYMTLEGIFAYKEPKWVLLPLLTLVRSLLYVFA